jgi:hypothetical protein
LISPGFAENPPREDGTGSDSRNRQLGLLAWRLASETVAVRRKQRTTPKASSDPLATTREIGKLFQMLQNDPFGTVAEIAADDALKNLDADHMADFADLIEAYTETIAKLTPARA